MDVDVIRHSVLVKEVSGDVVVVSVDGSARKAQAGDTITQDHIVITANNSSITLEDAASEVHLNANCVACGNTESAWNVAPVSAEVGFDLEQLGEASLSEDDLAAIQDAILAGEDPTEILEATAAGGAAGSANAGFVTLEFNVDPVLASTFFETTGFTRDAAPTFDEDNRPTRLPEGGESIATSVTEGTVSLSTYPQSSTTSITVFSGDLSLDPDSFVPLSTSLTSLLAELSSDITSSGGSVTFRYDATENTIIGENAEGVVLSIQIEGASQGNDVDLQITTTISQPIDHLPSVGAGQVSFVDDQITVSFQIQGADDGGNALLLPVEAQVTIEDGIDPIAAVAEVNNLESDDAAIEGTLVQIGSDLLSSVVFDDSVLAQFEGLLSDNKETQASLSADSTLLTLSVVGSDDPVLTVSLSTDGSYTFQQFKPLEHNGSDGSDNDVLTLSLATIITDFDQDSVANSINVSITDGDNPIITGVSSIDLDESGVAGGSTEGVGIVSGSGKIDVSEGSDAIDHFELEPSEFNTSGALTSQGEVIQLEFISLENGVRNYEGFIELNGSRITVFEASLNPVDSDNPLREDYSFTLLEQIDHLGDEQDTSITINLPVYAMDADGDRSRLSEQSNSDEAAFIQVNVQDDNLSLLDGVFSVTEPTTAGSEVVTHSLFEYEGADTATIQSFTYSGDSYTLNPNLGDDAMQTFEFTEGTLSISLNGEFEFSVARDIDHSQNETITKQFVFTAKDADGDIDTATVDLSITDGQDPIINTVPSVSLSETQLDDGSSATNAPVSTSASISYAEGSDDISYFEIAVAEFNSNGSLTSSDLAVQLREDPEDSGQYVGFTKDGNDPETTIFTLTFDNYGNAASSDKGRYTFTLLEALDHADGQQNNTLSFDLPVYAIDTDTSSSEMTPLMVTIEDDLQSMRNDSLTITEPSLDDINGATAPSTGTVNVFESLSADGATITQFSYDGGDAVALNPNITTEQAFTVDEGTLYLTIAGDVRFEPNRDLDHSDGNGGFANIVKTLVATSSDSDKDVETSSVKITITDGDDPVISTVPSVSLSETNLSDGSNPTVDPVSTSASIVYTEGSDDISYFEIATDEFNTHGALTSNDLAVQLREDPADSGQYVGFTKDGNDPETTIFTLSFDNYGNATSTDKGRYTFTLLEALDHADGQKNNSLSFNLPVYAIDTDTSRSVMKPLMVTIEDDLQSMRNDSLTITEPSLADTNGSTAPSTGTVNVFEAQSADGATVTKYSYDGNDVVGFDPTLTGEQSFDVDEGTLYLNINGDVRFEPNRDLDHSDGNGGFANIVKTLVATSSDGDKDVEASRVTITISDGDEPTINTVPGVSLSETNLSDGSDPTVDPVSMSASIVYTEGSDDISYFEIATDEFNTGGTLTSNDLAVQLREDPADSGQYVGFTKDGNDPETQIFTLTFDNFGNATSTDKGRYTFTLLEALDHADGQQNNSLSFNLPVYAIDTDTSSSVMKPLMVTIEDDAQLMTNGSLTITEPSLADYNLAGTNGATAPSTGTVNVFEAQSADGATVTKYSYDGNDVVGFDSTLTGEQSFDVDEGTLYLNINGDVRFEPNRDLDHSDGNGGVANIVKTLVATSSDGDKDVEASRVTITISDGDEPIINTVPSVSLSETNLSDGSDPTIAPVSTSASIDYTEGSDDISYFEIAVAEFNAGGTLTSNDLAVQLREDPADSGQYVGFTKDGNEPETQIFTLSFDNYGNATSTDKGRYTFTLLEALDHADGEQNNTLSFNLPVYAIDTDTSSSVMKPLNVSIVDDVPVIEGITDTSDVDVLEDGLSLGSPQASGQFVTEEGADGVVSYELQNTSDTASGLFSGGEPIVISQTTGTATTNNYQGVANGVVIFTLSLTSEGAYTFTLLESMDHLNDTDNLSIPFDVVAKDADGDYSEGIDLEIDVSDDKPSFIGTGTTGETQVDEDDLVDIGSDQTEDTSISGFFTIDEGADGVVEYELVDADETLDGLTSNGEALTWDTPTQTGTSFSYTVKTESGTPVFTITFDTSDNSYEFELLSNLDHSVANNEVNDTPDTLQIDFSIVATDFDQDSTDKITLPITIVDDVPLASEQSISRVEGQGFGGSKVIMFDAATDEGADTASLTKIEGTTEDSATIVFGGQRGVFTEFVDLREGRQNIRVYEQTDNDSGGQDTRQLGVLRINSNGEVEFRANNNLEHDGDEINFTINVTAKDGDLDTSVAPLDISISDKESRPISLKVVTFEDAGRDDSITYADGDAPELEKTQDNQDNLADSPAKVSLQVNLFDADNKEEIGSLTIKDGNHRGTFYFLKDGEYHKLEPDPTTGNIVFGGDSLQQTPTQIGANTIATIDNLYFVPDRHYSSGSGGVRIDYQLEINNNEAPDHTIDSNFRIEIKSVADIADWNDDRSTYYYEVEEDDSNVRLQLRAETQDTSRPETITYELKVTQGEGEFELLDRNGNPIDPVDGVYIIESRDINRIEVNPIDNFSGQIRFEATAITEERSNAYNDGVNDKSEARSPSQELIIDVTPSADAGTFRVQRAQINEDNIADPDYVGSEPNYNEFTLDEVITMNPSLDTDGSEVLFVRISEVTEDAKLEWIGAGDSQIVEVEIDGVTYLEIPYLELSNVDVVPEKHSNEDFSFSVTGVVKDSATLSDGTVHVHEQDLGTKTVNVEVKGVADVPIGATIGSHWEGFVDGDVRGVQTSILESHDGDNYAELDFSVISGERINKPFDSSESITVLLSNIPEGVVIEDSDGTQVDINFIGYDDNHQPIYEANISGFNANSGILIRPIDSSTENIHIKATVIVTENDGHVISFDQEVRVNVAPVIDTTLDYDSRSVGNEDQPINIDWHPQSGDYFDEDEHFLAITIENIPKYAEVIVNNALVEWEVVDSDDGLTQVLTIKPDGMTPEAFTEASLKGNFIQITPPKDSSADFTLNTKVEVEERDHEYTSDDIIGEGGRVTATLTGEVKVVVRAVVEVDDSDTDTPSNYLGVTDEDGIAEYSTIYADGQGVIRFTTNSDNQSLDDDNNEAWDGEYVIRYNETDASSDEVISDVIIELTHSNGTPLSAAVVSQLLVTGAAYEGDGRWIITDEAAFSVSAPNGLTLPPDDAGEENNLNDIKMVIETLVIDEGEDTNERSPEAERSGSVSLVFPESVVSGDEKAADIEITENSVITATEDKVVNLGEQLDAIITLTVPAGDTSADEVTIILDDSVMIGSESYPISVSGAEVDFINGQFVFQTNISDSGVVESFTGLNLTLPADYSGDFRLPIKVITKDTTSGDTNVAEGNVVVKVDPIADVNGNNPGITLEVLGSLDDDMVPMDLDGDENNEPDTVGYEDSYIQLDFGYQLADTVSGIEGGQESLSSITLTVEGDVGAFYDSNGDIIGPELTFDQSDIAAGALDNVLFRAKDNYPGADDKNEVTINVSGTVVDKATFNEFDPDTFAEHTDTFETKVSFEVVPVLDGVNVVGLEDGETAIEVTTLEDTAVSLGALSPVTISLTDLDGSESFVSMKFVDVPDGFLLTADSGYAVKNNGDGVWSVNIPSDAGSTLDLGAISILPPKNFSGSADFGIVVFTQESLLAEPTAVEGLPTFVLNVTPVGDEIDIDATDAISGLEGVNIAIDIDASIIDRTEVVTGQGSYIENRAEVIRVEVTGVPQDATILYPNGTTPATYDAATDTWTLDVLAQNLDKIVFNSGQHNSDDGNALGIDAPLTITVQSVDKDADDNEYLGPPRSFDVALTIDAVNDQPTFVNVSDLETKEDNAVAINTFTIADVDATFDDPDAEYALTLEVDKGSLTYNDYPNVTFSIDSQGGLQMVGKVADINAALALGFVLFQPDSDSNDDNSSGPVTVTALVSDGGNNGLIDGNDVATSSTNQTTFQISVTDVNDQPEASNLDYGVILEEGQVIIYKQDLINATNDKEGDAITVTSVSIAEGLGDLVPSDDGTYWTFTAADEFNGNVKISYTVEDNGTSNGDPDPLQDSAEVSFVVEGVNDTPVIDGGHVTHVVDEASDQLISGINISDPDYVGDYADELMTVNLTVNSGSLSVNVPVGSSISVTGQGTSSIALIGTLAELNAVIDTPAAPNGVYIDAADVDLSNIELIVVATDSGFPSGSVITTEPMRYEIQVTPVADAPTLTVDPALNYIKNITASETASANGIAIVGLLAALTDNRETLTLKITGLHDGAKLTSEAGDVDDSTGDWIVTEEQLATLKIEDSPAGDYQISVTAVSTESNSDVALSNPVVLNLKVIADTSIIDASDKDDDQLVLGDGDDSQILSGIGNDRLEGGSGHNELQGGGGNDTLLGGDGNDVIDGGAGYDVLTGGAGMDTFVWHDIDNGAVDKITDFHVDEGDKIDLREVLPELRMEDVNMDTLLGHVEASIDGNNIELHIHPNGEGAEDQTILVEDLVPQLTLGGSESNDILTALIDQQIIIHEI
ncbi:retention module-containing protein [Vibrio amylolyticus]|uniref:retention module-containing protein n=1 Tax=Vibrio amylolyticus TaxID=2847292 RepID=UPI00354E4858